jgi:hypothetical protein
MEPNPTPPPFAVFRGDIFGYENHSGGPPDEFVFFRAKLRRDQREHRRAIGRCHRDPTVARLKPRVERHFEPELIHEESQAFVLVPHENLNGVDAEVLALRG